jgi:hypothetical protein
MNFKLWCMEKWFEHVDEMVSYRWPVTYTYRDYIQKYKWWLKSQYKLERKNT